MKMTKVRQFVAALVALALVALLVAALAAMRGANVPIISNYIHP